MYHSLRRDGAEHRVDSDVWLCALDLALSRGWRPGGVDPPGGSYVVPKGQVVSAPDARELASYVSQALTSVPDSTLPLTDKPFGDEHTLALIAGAAKGTSPSTEHVAAARELLSGPPKSEALALTRFLEGGSFSIHPGR